MSWDHSFELPVRIVSREGADTKIATCNGCTGSSTQEATIAMQRAAAKALNKSGKLNVEAKPDDVAILGAGRSRIARYVLGKAVQS